MRARVLAGGDCADHNVVSGGAPDKVLWAIAARCNPTVTAELGAHSPSEVVNPRLQLGHAGLANSGSSTDPAEFRVHNTVGLAPHFRADPHQAVEEGALFLEGAVKRLGLGCFGRRPRR